MQNLKKCTTCGQEKDIQSFTKQSASKSGVTNECKKCKASSVKQYYHQHKQQRNEYNKQYRKDNPDRIKAIARKGAAAWRSRNPDYAKKFRIQNLEKCRASAARKMRNRRARDAAYRLLDSIRRRVNKYIESEIKNASTIEFLGCSIEDLKIHLESKFTSRMNWKNHSRFGWHIDHIRPCSTFDLSDPDQQKQCFHYTNLQPLWWNENIAKGGTNRPQHRTNHEKDTTQNNG